MLTDRSPEWEQARCKNIATDTFFVDGDKHHPDTRYAKQFCGGCPIVTGCFEYALARPELDGIWGATSSRDRSNIRRKIEDAKRKGERAA